MNEQFEAAARARWASDPKIAAEFGTFKTYLAFEKARADGAVKIYGQNKTVGAGPVQPVRKPSIEAILGPPEIPNPAPEPSPAARQEVERIERRLRNELAGLQKHGVDIKGFTWTPESCVVKIG